MSAPVDEAPPSSPTLARVEQGTTLGRFLVLEVLDHERASIVCSAYDTTLRREVTLRWVQAGEQQAPLRESAEARLDREAQSVARLSHANVVSVYDVIRDGDRVVLAMEYVQGQTLRSWLDETDREWLDVLAKFGQAGLGLAAAHRAGIVHRSFAASCVLLSEEGRVLVSDFGLETNAATPATMAPEQHLRQEVDPRADQYAFCAAVWEAVCRAPPFVADDVSALVRCKLGGPPMWPSSVRVPAPIVAALQRGLSPQPEQRWPTMEALLEALAHDANGRRKRITGALVALSAVASGGAWAWAWHADREQLCSGARTHLVGVWDDARRGAIQTALLEVDVDYASETWTRIEAALDRYAAGWAEQHAAACRATVLEASQSEALMELRMSCLHQRKAALRATADVLAAADRQVVEKAVQLVASLPSLSRCADVEALQAEIPPPEDPGDAAQVEVARVLLTDADVQLQAGKYDAALQEVQRARSALGDVEYPPVQAELAYVEGNLLDQKGDYQASEQMLEQAMQAGLTSGSSKAAVHATSLLGFVVGERQTRLAEGLRLAKMAVELARGQRDGGLEAHARNNLANVLYQRGRYAEAEAEHRAALALREQIFGPENPDVAISRTNLGVILWAQARHEEALEQLRTAHRLWEAVSGPQHPYVAATRNNLGLVLHEQGHHVEAEQEFRAVLDNRTRTLGPDHPWTADAHNNLGLALGGQGRFEEAEAEQRKALAARLASLGPKHPRVADSFENLGLVLTQGGRFAEAEAEHRKSLVLRVEVFGNEHPAVADSHENLGIVLFEQGRFAEAEVEHREALGLRRKLLGSDHVTVAHARARLGMALEARKRYAEAEAELRLALASYEKTIGLKHPSAIDAQRYLERVVQQHE